MASLNKIVVNEDKESDHSKRPSVIISASGLQVTPNC